MLDTNVLVSAIIGRAGPPGQILARWKEGNFDLVSSMALLSELQSVIQRPALRPYIAWSPAEIAQLMADLRIDVVLVDPGSSLQAIATDPDDNRALEAAVAGEANFIVSGDNRLLALGGYANIPILPPTRFLAMLQAEHR